MGNKSSKLKFKSKRTTVTIIEPPTLREYEILLQQQQLLEQQQQQQIASIDGQLNESLDKKDGAKQQQTSLPPPILCEYCGQKNLPRHAMDICVIDYNNVYLKKPGNKIERPLVELKSYTNRPQSEIQLPTFFQYMIIQMVFSIVSEEEAFLFFNNIGYQYYNYREFFRPLLLVCKAWYSFIERFIIPKIKYKEIEYQFLKNLDLEKNLLKNITMAKLQTSIFLNYPREMEYFYKTMTNKKPVVDSVECSNNDNNDKSNSILYNSDVDETILQYIEKNFKILFVEYEEKIEVAKKQVNNEIVKNQITKLYQMTRNLKECIFYKAIHNHNVFDLFIDFSFWFPKLTRIALPLQRERYSILRQLANLVNNYSLVKINITEFRQTIDSTQDQELLVEEFTQFIQAISGKLEQLAICSHILALCTSSLVHLTDHTRLVLNFDEYGGPNKYSEGTRLARLSNSKRNLESLEFPEETEYDQNLEELSKSYQHLKITKLKVYLCDGYEIIESHSHQIKTLELSMEKVAYVMSSLYNENPETSPRLTLIRYFFLDTFPLLTNLKKLRVYCGDIGNMIIPPSLKTIDIYTYERPTSNYDSLVSKFFDNHHNSNLVHFALEKVNKSGFLTAFADFIASSRYLKKLKFKFEVSRYANLAIENFVKSFDISYDLNPRNIGSSSKQTYLIPPIECPSVKGSIVLAFGNNAENQLAQPNPQPNYKSVVPIPSTYPIDVGTVSCGFDHCFFVTKDGKLFFTGSNKTGQLGVTTCNKADKATYHVNSMNVFKKVFCSQYFTVFISDKGGLFASGKSGLLGLPNDDNKSMPTAIPALQNKKIELYATGPKHSVAVDDNGNVYGWGRSNLLGLGNLGSKVKGMAVQIREPSPIEHTAFLNNRVVSIACGEEHTICLLQNGSVYGWGRGEEGQLGNGVKETRSSPTHIETLKSLNIVSVSCGYWNTAAITADKQCYIWGQYHNNIMQPKQLSIVGKPLAGVEQISQSGYYNIVLAQNEAYTFGVEFKSSTLTAWDLTKVRIDDNSIACKKITQVAASSAGFYYIIYEGTPITLRTDIGPQYQSTTQKQLPTKVSNFESTRAELFAKPKPPPKPSTTTTTTTSTTFTVFSYDRDGYSEAKRCSPISLPIIGDLYLLGKNPHHDFTNLTQKYGHIIKFWMGDIYTVIVSDPKMVREIFVKNVDTFIDRVHTPTNRLFSNNFSSIVFADEKHWRINRAIVANAFTKTKIKHLVQDIIESQSDLLVQAMKQYAKSGQLFKPRIYLKIYSLNIIMKYCVSDELSYDQDSVQQHGSRIHKLTEPIDQTFKLLGSARLDDFINLISPLSLFIRKIKYHPYEKMREYVREYYQEHQKKLDPNNPIDLMDTIILESKDKDCSSENQISIITDFLIAGTDTAAGAIEWFLLYMANYPEVLEKAYQELISTIGKGNRVKLDDKKLTPYINSLIKEVMRIRPNGPLGIPRLCVQDITLDGGLFIPKGAQVIQNIHGLSTSDSYWDRPKEFLPERFLNDNHSDTFIPFSVGNRNCIGSNLAETELYCAISNIIMNFKIKSSNGQKIDDSEIFAITVQPPEFNLLLELRE
eukprot:gene5537-6896_t